MWENSMKVDGLHLDSSCTNSSFSSFEMPPKVDPTQLVQIYVRVVGGEAGAASSLAPKVGPLGLSPKVIGDQLAAATKEYMGLRVRVRLDIQNRKATCVPEPSASTLIIKALKEPVRDRKKVKNVLHNGDLSLRDVIGVAEECRDRSMSVHFAGTLKEIFGTCRAIGCTIDGQSPQDWIEQINESELTTKEEIEAQFC
ncbi:hypothetical protein P9112_007675 [Eukaryota sp. TZLM1-RC]